MLDEILRNISSYSGLPGILFFIFLLGKKDGNARIAFFILLASFLADCSNYFFIRYIYPNSFYISNTWYLVNYFLVSFLFVKLTPQRRKLNTIFTITFAIGSIISFSLFFSFGESNTFIRSFSSVAFSILSILAFYEILKANPQDQLKTYPVFWIVSAIFLYSSVTLLKNLFQNYLVFDLQVSSKVFPYIAIFNLVFNIAKNLMFFYAFILVKKGFPDYIYQPKPVNA